MKNKAILAFLVTFIVLLLDQVSKIWVKTTMHLNQEIAILGSWFNLHFVENEGMAMGISWGGEIGKYSLTLFRIVAIIGIIYYIYILIKKKASTKMIFVMALVLAGAMGNVLDSLFYGLIFSESNFNVAQFVPWGTGYKPFMQGSVVDMISIQLFKVPNFIPVWGGHKFFPYIFNIADAAISVGIFLIIFYQKEFFAEKEEVKTPELTPTSEV